MITLRDLYPPDAEGGYSEERLADMQRRVSSAYGALFSGKGGIEDAELVLVDLAQFTRYLDTARLDTPADQVKALDQRRAVFARIAEGMVFSGGDLDGLQRAVLTSPSLSVEET